MYIGNVMLLILNLPLVPLFAQVLRMPVYVLYPLILGVSMVGVYSVSGSLFDLLLLMVFGLLGYLMRKLDYPAAPLILGLALGAGMERALRQSLMMSEGKLSILVSRPISAVAAAHLAEKRGDPNTLGLFTGVWLQTPLVSAEAKVTLRDLTPIARLVLEPAVIAVKADAPYKTLAEFIEAAKKNPGQLKQSGGSNTSRDNVVRQLLQKSTGARWAFISFPGGGERIAALLGGHVDIMVIEPEEAGEHIRAGNMRVLAQVSEKRLAKFPEVPTLKEAGFDVPVVPQVRGVVAPPGIPKENVEFWQDFFRRLTRTPSWRKYIEDNQFEDGYQNAAELAKFYDEFKDRMREILKDAGVKTVR